MKKYLMFSILVLSLSANGILGYLYLHHPKEIIKEVIKNEPLRVSDCDYRGSVNFDNILVLINEYRIENGLETLGGTTQLNKYAELRAEEVYNAPILSHQTQYGGFFPWLKSNGETNTTYKSINENLAKNARTTCEAIDGWKKSPTHNASIINPEAKFMGVGVYKSAVVLEIAT